MCVCVLSCALSNAEIVERRQMVLERAVDTDGQRTLIDDNDDDNDYDGDDSTRLDWPAASMDPNDQCPPLRSLAAEAFNG